ncbi:MAG: 2-hydroxyacyl-CoA dehydratase family protein [Treponema sp.]|jgi:benzoyl-CoA reductase/2-hydroxyglutaryl-CoA dehydratase subunit BcrC/BadD/HgdB|nr:2-hydroxyacyl-CoA dehydratase family protein [Treponema sp.]
MGIQELLSQFHAVASDPSAQKNAYLAKGKKIALTAPVYTPEEIIHSMGIVPMGVWGGDLELKESKKYFPAFICSIMQSLVEIGMRGTYEGASAIVIPSLCDSLKVLGQNWKYAVPSIPFIPMTYPQNRKPEFGADFTRAGYERVICDLEKVTGLRFDPARLDKSLEIYNEHNAVMRDLSETLSGHPEILVSQRSDIFKSAFFILKEEHTALVRSLLSELKTRPAGPEKIRIMTSGILADAPALTGILDEYGMQVAADDIAAESRQYRVDAPQGNDPLDRLVQKFRAMDNCSVLYDPEKKRVAFVVEEAKARKARGVLVILTKFCDPEEFDYPLIKRACEANKIPCIIVEVDRQMVNYEQARTVIETFRDLLSQKQIITGV